VNDPLRVVVTGGSGFIGTNLIELLNSLGFSLLSIDIMPPRNPLHMNFWRDVDVCNVEMFRKTLKEFNPNVIYHLAARTDLNGNTLADYKANIEGVKNIIDFISSLKSLKLAVFASSRLVCEIGYQPKGDDDYLPNTIYGESKIIGEKIIRSSSNKIHCPWVIVRPTSIWGPWFATPYKDFFNAIKSCRYFHPSGKKIRKSFGFVGNSSYQLLQLIENANLVNGKTLYLCDNEPINLEMMANLIQMNFNVKKIKKIPIWMLRLLALFGDFLKIIGFKNPPLTTFRLNNLLQDMIYDNSPLSSICPRLPYNFEQSVSITCDWIKAQELSGQ
jgi:nucleoside-diphosphate-sugar epimerase